jgi:phosphopantothenoylcysteine decarboxylase/phosphopantothenate--cysteine ligase
VQHIGVTDAADLTLIAPATANLLAKIAAGIADDLVSTLMVSAASPILLAPAMNARMWANPIVQRNVATLAALGYRTVGPGEGWLACRTVGPGRMAEPVEIVDAAVAALRGAAPKSALPKRGT